jgi:hypothetical protein
MAYDQADIEEFSYLDSTFGATSVTHNIIGPKGKVGFVRDISVDVTTALVGTTTVPEIQVGISSGDFTYGRYRLGTTASAGYGVGMHRASVEGWTGNPPRTLGDFAGHVVLDGGPLTSQGIAGGSFGTQVPQGRIPASPFHVTNAVSGTGSVVRLILQETIPTQLVVGQTVVVQGVAGATGANGTQTVSAINTNGNYIELTGTTFGGTYTAGGLVSVVAVVTCLAGTGGSPAGGGQVRVKIQWIGSESD